MGGRDSWRVAGRVTFRRLRGNHHSSDPCVVFQHLEREHHMSLMNNCPKKILKSEMQLKQKRERIHHVWWERLDMSQNPPQQLYCSMCWCKILNTEWPADPNNVCVCVCTSVCMWQVYQSVNSSVRGCQEWLSSPSCSGLICIQTLSAQKVRFIMHVYVKHQTSRDWGMWAMRRKRVFCDSE